MRFLSLMLTLVLGVASPALAQTWAMDGLDPVGSLEQGHPVPGRGNIATLWRGQVWHFASEENRSRFEADPRRFAPAFGGLCPVYLSRGERVPGDTRHAVTIGKRVYLPSTAAAAAKLREAPGAIIDRARANWRR